MTSNHMRASKNPLEDIEKVSYEGQDPNMKRYAFGYEEFMDNMPILENGDSLNLNMIRTESVMAFLSEKIKKDKELMLLDVKDNKFKRTIVALEPPELVSNEYRAKSEIIVAHWGKGFKSPIHGHSTGLLYEEVLSGMIKVYNYTIVDEEKRIVRPHSIQIIKEGVFVSEFAPHTEHENKRRTLVHNFEAIERSNTLHYLPEHTRDGRDNTFTLEQWEDFTINDVERINSFQGLNLPIGSVVLVRSSNVPEYGDHFIIVTGRPIVKEHGIRPQDMSIMASSSDSTILDAFPMIMGLTLLKLSEEKAQSFHRFHNTKYIK